MSAFLAENPLGILALLLGLSVLVPPVFRRLGLPDLVGLLGAGVLIGPHVLGWMGPQWETVKLLSDVGVVYLLFIAGLEIDLAEFRRVGRRAFRFGLLTFTLPMAAGTVLGIIYGYPIVSALLIGSILASHTPLGYPIVRSYGAVREESVTVAIGGTIFTDIAALVVLALLMSLGSGQLTGLTVVALLLKVAIYAALVVILIRSIGHLLVERCVDNDGRLFVAVLLALFLTAVGAEIIGVEKIVGAFLAGLAVNAILPDGRVKEQVIVVGASLFIPIFFIDLGLLLDLPVFVRTMAGFGFAVALIVTLISSKGLASFLAGWFYRYSGAEILTLWSLSIPQVAATLAATYVGYRGGLLDDQVLNSVIAMMVVTATLGPMLTAVAMKKMGEAAAADLTLEHSGKLALARRSLRVLVPIANPTNEEHLLGIASRLIGGDAGQKGVVLPLAVVSPRLAEAASGPDEGIWTALARGRELLQQAERISAEGHVASQGLLRVDTDIPGGIARTALEQGVDLVVVGIGQPARLGRWLFGDLVDGICRQAHCPVVVARLERDPAALRRLLVPVKDVTGGALEQFQLAERIARSCREEARITLLHVHDPRLADGEQEQLRQQLENWIPTPRKGENPVPVQILLVGSHSIDAEISHASQQHDLVILRSLRRMVAGLPIPASDRATTLLLRLRCSTLVISDPLH